MINLKLQKYHIIFRNFDKKIEKKEQETLHCSSNENLLELSMYTSRRRRSIIFDTRMGLFRHTTDSSDRSSNNYRALSRV